MPICIEEDISGRLILNINSEKELSANSDFSDILLSFNVFFQTPYRLLIDTGNNVIESIEYLLSNFENIGVTVTLSEELNEILNRARARK